MVNEIVNIRDKHRVLRKTMKISAITLIVLVVFLAIFAAGFLIKKPKIEIHLENPLKNIIFANTNAQGEVNKEAVIEQAVIEFNEDYINYLLAALGTGYLHKSILGENPFLELILEDEIWHAEIIDGMPHSALGSIDNKDLIITISKEEAIKAILSENIGQFIKNSYANGNLGIEIIASKPVLFAKGYLNMYKELTGEDISIE